MIKYSFNINNNDILKTTVGNIVDDIIHDAIKDVDNNISQDININNINEHIFQNSSDADSENENDDKIVHSEYDYDINSWDEIITNKSYLLKNRMMRIFPSLKNKNDYTKLKIDDESFSFITIREMADFTSKIICHHLITDFTNPLKVAICDLTAGVGGNVISFSNYFNTVHAVELEVQRYDYLINKDTS